MQLIVKARQTFVITTQADATVWQVKQNLALESGIPAQEQVLHVGGKRLPDSISLTAARICDGDLLTLTGRLRGGAPTLTLTIKPRVQKDKWSLYWKESMETKTELLSEVIVKTNPSATVAEIQAQLQSTMGWPAANKCERLEGFKDPWEVSVYKGRSMDPKGTLEAHGITSNATITSVRRVLVPEGWKIITEGEDEDDISSDEDW